MRPRILLIETDADLASALMKGLEAEGYETVTATNGDEGLAVAKKGPFNVVITALKLPSISGLEVVRQLHITKRQLPIIMMTGSGTTESAIEATRQGAFDYLTKPFEMPALLKIVAQAVSRNQPPPAALPLAKIFQGKSRIIGSSLAMQKLYKEIGRAARSSLSVLICGETGSGKELVARAIHDYSAQAGEPFVAVNSAAIPDTLLESELFGHERSAFTNADARRIGCFERAKRGTIFLDEIGDLIPATQVKLLRVIQEKYLHRVGGNERIPVEARILSATNQDLDTAIREKRFREDLFYRLTAITIHVPSLSQRLEDVPELVSCFVQRCCAESGIETPSIRAEAIEFLQGQIWIGNVRELENVVGHALLLAGDDAIGLADVQQACATTRRTVSALNRTVADYLADLFLKPQKGEIKGVRSRMLEDMERELFATAIRTTKGNQAKAALWLGVTRRTVREKLIHFGIHQARKRT